MSLKIDRLQLEIIINNDQARKSLRLLEDEARQLRKDLKKVPEGSEEWKKINDRLKSIQQQHDNLISKLGIEKLTIKELGQRQRELNSIMRNLDPSSKAYKDLEKQLIAVKNRQAQLRSSASKTNLSLSKMAGSFNKYFSMIATFTASITGIVLGFRKAVNMANDFGEELANLSALTGLVGDELDYLSERAKGFSGSITEDGIRITKSAQDIVKGFTIMGSARPELLKDKEALADVTEQALILAAAAKIEMEPAIDAVAAAMNQFNLPAEESKRIINAIAAGSLEGSAEVTNITESLANVGTVAADSNMSLEQTVATLEVLAERQLKGSDAGTQLRSTLISLKAAGLGYVSGAFNMRDAIIELKARIDQKNTAQEKDNVLIDVFGKRNITVGTILSKSIDRYDYFTKAVTNTNTAVEQAIKNTDHNKARLEAARQELNKMVITLGEKLAPALTFSTSSFSYLIRTTVMAIDFFGKYGKQILIAVAAMAGYYAAVKIAASWDKIHYGFLVAKDVITKAYGFTVGLLTGKIKIATIAQKAWNLAQKMNPIGAIVGILLAAGTALALYTKRLSAAQQAQKELNNIETIAKKSITEQRIELESLLKIARDETKSKEERLNAVKRLNEISPEFLGNLTLEKINTQEATNATNDYTAALEKQARVQAAKEKLVELEKELIDLQQEGAGANIKWYQGAWNYITSFGNIAKATEKNTISALENINQKTADIEARKKALLGIIDTGIVPVNQKPKPNDFGDEITSDLPEGDIVDETKKQYDEILAIIEEFKEAKQNELRQAYLDEKLDKEEFDRQMAIQELTNLEAQKALAESYGFSTVDFEKQILQKKISLFEAELAARKKVNDEKLADEKETSEESKRLAEIEYQKFLDKIELLKNFSSIVNNTLEDAMAGNENALKEGARQILLLALDVLKTQTELAIAGVTIQGLATLNPAGVFKAAAKVIAIEAAFAAVKGLVTRALLGKPEVAQYATGNYQDVIGQQDGRKYRARVTDSKHPSGLFSEPTFVPGFGLFGETKKPELVFNPKDTQKIIDSPALIRAINHTLGVRQFASGNYEFTRTSSPDGVVKTDPVYLMVLDLFNKVSAQLARPLKVDSVKFPMHDFKKASKEYDDIEELVKRK